MNSKILILVFFAAFVMVPFSLCAADMPHPGPKDKCPVCGMFTEKYQDFLGSIELTTGRRFWFDGAKDLFKFYLDPSAYGTLLNVKEIKWIQVTDYYAVQLIDAGTAWYVLGSDVYGPMGHELIPFAKEADAKEFMKDHQGKRLLRFQDIQRDILKGLE